MASVVFPFPHQQYHQHSHLHQPCTNTKIPFIFTIDPEQINCFEFSPSQFNVLNDNKKRNVIHPQTYPYVTKPKEKKSLTRSNSWSFDLSR